MGVKLKPCLAQNISIWIMWQLYLCTNETTVNSLTLTWFCCFLCTDKSWSFVDVVFMGTTMDVKYFLWVHFFLLFYILRQIFFMRWELKCLLLEPEIWGGQCENMNFEVIFEVSGHFVLSCFIPKFEFVCIQASDWFIYLFKTPYAQFSRGKWVRYKQKICHVYMWSWAGSLVWFSPCRTASHYQQLLMENFIETPGWRK